MRERKKILANLEGLYREGYVRAEAEGDEKVMARLDFEFQRDQLYLEVALDVRDVLSVLGGDKEGQGDSRSLLEKAQAIRRLTRLR